MTGICLAICTCCMVALTACLVRQYLADEQRNRWWFARRQRQLAEEDSRKERCPAQPSGGPGGQ